MCPIVNHLKNKYTIKDNSIARDYVYLAKMIEYKTSGRQNDLKMFLRGKINHNHNNYSTLNKLDFH